MHSQLQLILDGLQWLLVGLSLANERINGGQKKKKNEPWCSERVAYQKRVLYICSLRYLIGDNLAGRKRRASWPIMGAVGGFGLAWLGLPPPPQAGLEHRRSVPGPVRYRELTALHFDSWGICLAVFFFGVGALWGRRIKRNAPVSHSSSDPL